MKTVLVNNKIGSRGREHRNLLLVPGQGIIKFVGNSIVPLLMVVREDYTKNGKWSHTTWTCEVREDCELLVFSEDWGTGFYFPVVTWAKGIEHLNGALDGKPREMGLSDESLIAYIRQAHPAAAEKFDIVAKEWGDA